MSNKIEIHPFEPFLPDGATILMLGTFPPKPERWSMPFFYPNRINDMWRIMGVIFFNNRDHFWIERQKCFNLPLIKTFLTERGIALWDTAKRVRRLKDNASDKFLEIVEPIDLNAFFINCPTLRHVVTAGEKATGIIADIAGVEAPKMGGKVDCELNGHRFTLFRMPSSSRAFPMSLERKADYYRTVFSPINRFVK